MKNIFCSRVTTQSGFSLVEVLTVIVVLGILVSISIPSMLEWRKSYYYRQASSGISGCLREARGRAISSNFQHRVELDVSAKRYRLTKGNRAYNTPDDASNWTIVQDWVILPSDVDIVVTPANLKVAFNANGTSNVGTIDIKDSAGNIKIQITVVATGRIKSTKIS